MISNILITACISKLVVCGGICINSEIKKKKKSVGIPTINTCNKLREINLYMLIWIINIVINFFASFTSARNEIRRTNKIEN